MLQEYTSIEKGRKLKAAASRKSFNTAQHVKKLGRFHRIQTGRCNRKGNQQYPLRSMEMINAFHGHDLKVGDRMAHKLMTFHSLGTMNLLNK